MGTAPGWADLLTVEDGMAKRLLPGECEWLRTLAVRQVEVQREVEDEIRERWPLGTAGPT